MLMNQDFTEFIKCLNKHDVKYLIVGGYAVAIHGHPRYTKDLDVWVRIATDNAEKILLALKEFGFSSLKLEVNDFTEPQNVIQLGYPPNRIDIITTASGIDFEESYANRLMVEIDGIKASFIDLENLKKNKRATGRYQDLADLEKLE